MNMNRHIITNTNEESLSMPSLLANLNNEVVHYYVDVIGVEEHNVGNEELNQEDNAEESQLLYYPHIHPSTGLVFEQFLRLLVERET